MADGTGAYTLVGVGGTITRTVAPNAVVTYNLAGAVSTFNITSNAGATVTINNDVDVADNLTLDTNGGAIDIGTLAGALGAVDVTIDKGGSFAAGATTIGLLQSGEITYGAGGGIALFGTANDFVNLSFAPVMHGFGGAGDAIDDRSLNLADFQSYSISGAGTMQTVTINDSAGNFSFSTSGANLPTGNFTSMTGGPLKLSSDGGGGVTIVACFLGGTMIATPQGEVAVETLKPGNLVTTRGRGPMAVRRLRRRAFNPSREARPQRILPVRIAAGALGDGLPHRDLYVSPDHSMYLDGVFVPAQLLLNGSSIMQPRRTATIEYYHIELDPHEVIFAEGAATESYLDVNGGHFADPGVVMLFGEPKTWEDACAPLLLGGRHLQEIRARLGGCLAAKVA